MDIAKVIPGFAIIDDFNQTLCRFYCRFKLGCDNVHLSQSAQVISVLLDDTLFDTVFQNLDATNRRIQTRKRLSQVHELSFAFQITLHVGKFHGLDTLCFTIQEAIDGCQITPVSTFIKQRYQRFGDIQCRLIVFQFNVHGIQKGIDIARNFATLCPQHIHIAQQIFNRLRELLQVVVRLCQYVVNRRVFFS